MGWIYRIGSYRLDNRVTGIGSLGIGYNRVKVIKMWTIVSQQMVWSNLGTRPMCQTTVSSRILSRVNFMLSCIQVAQDTRRHLQ